MSHMKKIKLTITMMGILIIGSLIASPLASAASGEFARFNQCPSTTTSVYKCMVSTTKGGEIILGKKAVPIVNPVTLQGGSSEPVAGTSTFFAAKNGETLSKTPQPVPGGLTGLVNCKEISLGWLRESCEAVFENGLTGVNATLELARPASEIRVSEINLLFEEGVALKLPVKVHLENPFLGSGCYIGSSSSPLIWNLTTGETTPPAGTKPLVGTSGNFEFPENGELIRIVGNELVENNWSAPGASGCGGWPAEYILDPIINASVGVPSAAGVNSAVLKNEIYVATATAVNNH